MSFSAKTRTRLTQQQKLRLIEKAKSTPTAKYEDLALWAKVEFGLRRPPGKATISRIISERITLSRQPHESAQRKNKPSAFQLQLDQNIVEFIMLAEAEGICLSGAMIVFYATVLAKKLRIPSHRQPRFGLSWLRCLQHRYGFRWRRAYGESSSVDLTKAKGELERIQAVVATYLPKNVFNMDESAFFYKAVPRGSICKKTAPALKQNKARVTMAYCANADGSEKLPLLFLGTAEKPRWYKDKPSSLQYMGTSKGWMTTWVYQQWLVGVNEEMARQDRRILLLVDNASSHDETGLCLTHVRVEKLPPNTTAKIQPMDQGIIYCVKREELTQKMMHALGYVGESCEDAYTVDLLTVMKWCESAWGNVSASTIQKCWLHSTLISKSSVSFILN